MERIGISCAVACSVETKECPEQRGSAVTDVPFRLQLVETPGEWVLVCTSPLGRAVSRMRPPFDQDELREALASVEKALIRSTSPAITRRAAPPQRVTWEFGQRLSDTLLAGDVRILYDRCREKAREQRSSLRILLDPDGPNVSRIPWEFIVDPNLRDDFLALRVPLVRSLNLMEAVPPLQVESPLRVLGVMSRPSDLPHLEVEKERRQISAALQHLSSDLVDVHWLPGDRWHQLASTLRSEPWHVLHFVGHGGFDDETESGYVELSGEDGSAIMVPATDLSRLVAENPELRLVVLNACESATTGRYGTFASTAAKLMREGVPAVVAMQYEITDPAALAFACTFYEGIARGLPVDRAVTLARENVKMTFRSLEWATPVLFLASEETRIFAVPERPPSPAGVQSSEWSTQVAGKLTSFFNRITSGPEPAADTTPTEPDPPVPPVSRVRVRPDERQQARGLVLPLVGTVPAVGPCAHLALGPGDLVAVACGDGSVRVLSMASGRQLAQCALPHRERPVRVSWSPWKRHLASQHESGAVVVWDLETEVPIHVVRLTAPRVESIAFSHDGRWLAIARSDRRVQVLDASGREVRAVTVPHDRENGAGWRAGDGSLTTLVFAPDDRHLLVADNGGVVTQLDVRGQPVMTWRHPQAVTALAVAGDRIATGSVDTRARAWSWDGRLLSRREHGARVDHVALGPGGHLAVASSDATCWLWDRQGQLIATAPLSGRPVGLGFASGARTLVTGTDAGVTQVWSLRPGEQATGGG
jgi:WD40 repeat protein